MPSRLVAENRARKELHGIGTIYYVVRSEGAKSVRATLYVCKSNTLRDVTQVIAQLTMAHVHARGGLVMRGLPVDSTEEIARHFVSAVGRRLCKRRLVAVKL